jgi:hypothetical protein
MVHSIKFCPISYLDPFLAPTTPFFSIASKSSEACGSQENSKAHHVYPPPPRMKFTITLAALFAAFTNGLPVDTCATACASPAKYNLTAPQCMARCLHEAHESTLRSTDIILDPYEVVPLPPSEPANTAVPEQKWDIPSNICEINPWLCKYCGHCTEKEKEGKQEEPESENSDRRKT